MNKIIIKTFFYFSSVKMNILTHLDITIIQVYVIVVVITESLFSQGKIVHRDSKITHRDSKIHYVSNCFVLCK